MKLKALHLIMLLILVKTSSAAGVGVAPDTITFDSAEDIKIVTIINPNDGAIIFKISSGQAGCTPASGELEGKNNIQVSCRSTTETMTEDGLILVETTLKDGNDKVGILPAIAVKITRKEKKESQIDPEYIDSSPLTISGEPEDVQGEKEEESDAETEKKRKMPPEWITIIILVAANLAVLAYSEIKNRKEENIKKEKDSEDNIDKDTSHITTKAVLSSSLQQDAPCGQASASAAASQYLPVPDSSHDGRAQSPLSLFPGR
ncbi:MAG: hypothetical protein V1729_00765 [Candidatus Woesearchaeota archaeon]